ncbi:MAG: M36 family metallopeptidase [Pseudomonadota bacterium]
MFQTPVTLRRTCAAFALACAAFSGPATALLENGEAPRQTGDADFRPGALAPSTAQLALVQQLGANANWNRFGTVHSMIRHGGYLATGLGGTPEQQARSFIKANASLFRLSPASVDALELVNEGITPHNAARAMLFRQRFGGLPSAVDGLITVGVVDGKVYYVSSSSAGDQPLPGAATLSPREAWSRAAANLGRRVPATAVQQVLDRTATLGWHMLDVQGFAQPQRTRLVALPMPAGGVRQAYETIVLDVHASNVLAFVSFVDAETGAILKRENRVDWQAAGNNTTPFQGAFADAASCGPRHDFEVGDGINQVLVGAAAAQPANDILINLYFNGSVVASNDLLTSPETLTYAPTGGVPTGAYQAEVCPFSAALPPLDYAGTITTSGASAGGTFNLPGWKYFGAYPHSDGADTRLNTCWTEKGSCDFVVGSIASRFPWDVVQTGNAPTMTTMGNNAITAESWGSPLTPSSMYRPVSPTRDYNFPFTNVWASSKCDPSNLTPTGNDIDASVAQLFASHNRMHDWSYFLGFTERNFNLQSSNFGLTPQAQENDPELGQAQAGAISGNFASPTFFQAPGRNNANQVTLNDGVPGITNQYLFQPLPGVNYPPCADANYDMSVVGHEYTHAITNRMIGGPDSNIGGDQGRAMGESWGDLTATEYMMELGYLPVGDAKPTALGAYATGDKERGIRNFAFDSSPLNYSNIGYDTPGVQVHADGEIWSATNWVVRQALIDKYQSIFPYSDSKRQVDCANGVYAADACPGNRRWVQMQFDSFLLMPAAPSMLDARDAMLASDLARFSGANQKEMWKAFASRGMGINAQTNGGSDGTPTPNFESPLEAPATLKFVPVAGDEGSTPVVGAKLYVGQFATRTRAIADTDPETVVDATDEATMRRTSNTLDTAKMVPGTYDFMVEAPGFGIHRFPGVVIAAGSNTLRITLPSNWASKTRGATAVTGATDAVDAAAAELLIDDTENTGVRYGTEAPVAGSYAIITLAGGPRSLSGVNVSAAAGPPPSGIEPVDPKPSNSGRYIALRQFELLSCTGTCAAPADFTKVIYTSPEDAFPGRPLRPTQPDLNIRSFSFAPVTASHIMLRTLTNQCTGQPLFQGDQDNDPTFNTDCVSYSPPPQSGVNTTDAPEGTYVSPVAPGTIARAAEIQLFGSPASVKVENVGGGSAGGGQIGSPPPATVSGDAAGRFGGGALGLGLLLPLLFGIGRRRRMA